jgi:cyclase
MRNPSIIRVLLVLASAGAMFVAYTQGPQPAKLDLVKIKDDLYVIHNAVAPGNVTVLITNEGVVLVDDKFEVDHDNIMTQLKTITNQPIKYVINTHHHPDHTGGNPKMLQMNAQIIASEQARENMVFGKQPGLPAVAIEGHAHVYLGGKHVELYQFGRAHTNGDVFVHFPAHRTLAAGDTFTLGDDVPQLIDYAGGGSAKEWTKTLDAALRLDFDTVVPGHGPVTTREQLRKFRDSTITLNNRIHDLLLQKKTRDEIAKIMQTEFHWGDLQLSRGLDGAMAELR